MIGQPWSLRGTLDLFRDPATAEKRRLLADRWAGLDPALLDGLRGRLRIGGFTFASHHFMSPEEVRTPVGQQRLDACAFRLPYKGEMVPMCKMNADGVRPFETL